MSSRENSLSRDENDAVAKLKEEYMKIGFDTTPIDKSAAENAISGLYKLLGRSSPEFIWSDSPRDVLDRIEKDGVNREDAFNNITYEQQDYEYFENIVLTKIGVALSPDSAEVIEVNDRVIKSCHWFVPCSEHCYCSERPVSIHVNSENRLHNENGPAIRYGDGFEIYAINGYVVEKPEE